MSTIGRFPFNVDELRLQTQQMNFVLTSTAFRGEFLPTRTRSTKRLSSNPVVSNHAIYNSPIEAKH
jgi:hypothetical protein